MDRSSSQAPIPMTVVVLVEPSLPENLGAVARLMANFGLERLRLVGGVDPAAPRARRVATHAEAVLAQAERFPDLAAAVADCRWVVGTTARGRGRLPLISLPELTARYPAGSSPVAFLFGREASGLTNDKLAHAHLAVRIPTHPGAPALNLSHAVAVTLYEWIGRRPSQAWAPSRAPAPATSQELEGLKHHLFRALADFGFLRPNQAAALWLTFAGLIGRAAATSEEVRLLRGVLRRAQRALEQAPRPRPSPPADTPPDG